MYQLKNWQSNYGENRKFFFQKLRTFDLSLNQIKHDKKSLKSLDKHEKNHLTDRLGGKETWRPTHFS